jgi:hypothetical protein
MFKKLANIFVDTGEEKKETPKTPEKTAPVPTPVATPVVPGQIDSEIAKIFEEAISAANLPGFDYFEFKDSLSKMAGMPMTEEQKYQAVFATAQVMGNVDKKSLGDSINHYIAVINKKAVEFNKFIETSPNAEIALKEKKVADMNNTMQQKAQEIEKLTKEIQELRLSRENLLAEVSQERIAVQQKVSSFEATKTDVLAKLAQDQQKMETYLK